MSKHLPLVKYGPWSPSKAALATTCALAFKYRYIDKVATGPRGSAASIGVAVHRAQELVLQGIHVTEAMDTAILETEADLTHKDKEKVKTFAQALIDFETRIRQFELSFPVKYKLLENKWAVTKDYEACDFFDERGIVRGIVDMSLVLESGHVIIIDHKTGRVRPAAYYTTQLHFYTVMALAHFPDLKGVQCALHYVAHSKLEWSNPVKPSYIKDVLQPWLIDYLNKKSIKAETPDATVGKHCDWCDFRTTCTVRGPNVKAGKEYIEGNKA